MHNPIDMMAFWNAPDPGHDPAPYRLADNPGDSPRQDDGGDLYEIGENENFIEQVPLELLEIRHRVLPDRERFDYCLPPNVSSVKPTQDGEADKRIQPKALGAGVLPPSPLSSGFV